MKIRKKLIEVALPLDAINQASAREKGNPFLKGHPRNLHQWWARRPLAAARAVIFSQMVDDPSEYVDVLLGDPIKRRKAVSVLKARSKVWEAARALAEKASLAGIEAPAPGPEPVLESVAAEIERERLFEIVRRLVLWENTTNPSVLQEARDEIWQSWRRTCAENADHLEARELFDRHRLPMFHDPFAGGGALPLEAQRLGLDAHASDLNPVAVLINKVSIEIPPAFSGAAPVNPESRGRLDHSRTWSGAEGLAEDVRYYARWIRDEAERRIGHLYPRVHISSAITKDRPDLQAYLGRNLPVVAWIWSRTVRSPNPAFATIQVPLASTFMLSTKREKEAYVEPIIEGSGYRFDVKIGAPPEKSLAKKGTKSGGSGSSFLCLMSGTPMPFEYIRSEAKGGRLGMRLVAVVAEGDRGKVYLAPTPEMESVAMAVRANDVPDVDLPAKALGFRIQEYGMSKWRDLFTERQLVALTTLSTLVAETRERVRQDAVAAGFPADSTTLSADGRGGLAYGEAVASIEALVLGKFADYGNTICTWNPTNQNVGHLFTKHAIPMAWDFPEASPLDGGLSFDSIASGVALAVENLPAAGMGKAFQHDSALPLVSDRRPVISTDPPYYDNIGYADLSDFFYFWLRRSLRHVFPSIFATLVVPKAEELVATPHRHGGRAKAEAFFLDGMTRAMHSLVAQGHPGFPVTIFYAFKQAETESEVGTASTGWETFLEAVLRAGFGISGTWPMRTEREARAVGQGTNSLASSIILVCRPRGVTSAATRREFIADLKAELPAALANLQRGSIAPVDLAQAAIGPGMAVFSKYAEVLDADGRALTVRQALGLINDVVDETLAQQEGDFDPESRWAITWLESHGFDAGPSGEAILLSTARGTALNALEQSGIVEAQGGKVRLLRPAELPKDWDPATDPRLTTWEVVHHLIRVLETGGEAAAAQMVVHLGGHAEVGRELAYRLFIICERKKRAAEALSYNGLVQSWREIMRLAHERREPSETQSGFFT